MSIPLTAQPAVRPRGVEAVRTRAAVLVAHGLSALPPRALAGVLRLAVRGRGPAGRAAVARARAHVCAVSERCAGEGCLPRSIAVVLLCRGAGAAPVWKTGYRVSPFGAHAWVEAEGAPVDEPDDLRRFTTVLAVGPAARDESRRS